MLQLRLLQRPVGTFDREGEPVVANELCCHTLEAINGHLQIGLSSGRDPGELKLALTTGKIAEANRNRSLRLIVLVQQVALHGGTHPQRVSWLGSPTLISETLLNLVHQRVPMPGLPQLRKVLQNRSLPHGQDDPIVAMKRRIKRAPHPPGQGTSGRGPDRTDPDRIVRDHLVCEPGWGNPKWACAFGNGLLDDLQRLCKGAGEQKLVDQ
jgi:hypothetical protein